MFCFDLIDAALVEATNLARHLGIERVVPTIGTCLLPNCIAPIVGNKVLLVLGLASPASCSWWAWAPEDLPSTFANAQRWHWIHPWRPAWMWGDLEGCAIATATVPAPTCLLLLLLLLHLLYLGTRVRAGHGKAYLGVPGGMESNAP